MLERGSKRCCDWLRTKKAGDIVTRQEIMDASGWIKASLKTYFGKNKLAPFLLPLGGDEVKVLTDGKDLTEQYFMKYSLRQRLPKSL